jgi:hypothetical protein
MRDLTVRLSALAPEAASALKVIAYFDQLIEHGAGVRSVIRGAAILSGCPACLLDRSRGMLLRTLPDGTSAPSLRQADRSWPRADSHDGILEVWLERDEPADADLDALILERALLAAAASRGRTRQAPGHREEACVQLLVAADCDSAAREDALHRLGLTAATPVCLIATPDANPRIARSASEARIKARSLRAGIGPLVPARDAARSWRLASLALYLTAAGTPQDPGDRVVLADEAGALLILADKASPRDVPPADIALIESAAASAPWMFETLQAISTTNSVRDAAALLHLHHSTVQERAARAERLLGWEVLSQRGKQRLQLALVMRRIFAAIRAQEVIASSVPMPLRRAIPTTSLAVAMSWIPSPTEL